MQKLQSVTQRSQQWRKIAEDSDKSEQQCDLVVKDFGSSEEIEIMSVQTNKPMGEKT